MCLIYNKEMTEELFGKADKIVTFKVLRKVLRRTSTQFLISPVISWFTWQPGWNAGVAARKTRQLQEGDEITSEAVHVFLEKEAAEKWLNPYESLRQDTDKKLFPIVPVKCYKADLIAAGYFEAIQYIHCVACFSKVWLDPADYAAALQED